MAVLLAVVVVVAVFLSDSHWVVNAVVILMAVVEVVVGVEEILLTVEYSLIKDCRRWVAGRRSDYCHLLVASPPVAGKTGQTCR